MPDAQPGAKVVDARTTAYLGGQRDYNQGRPCPPNIWSDDEWRKPCNEGMCRWLGWMTARAMVLMRHDRVRNWAEDGGPLPYLP